jgi:hypothetical protein
MTPARSDPRTSGKGCGITLRPARTQAFQGPTSAALTRTNTCASPGTGRVTSSYTMASNPPNWCTRTALIKGFPALH